MQLSLDLWIQSVSSVVTLFATVVIAWYAHQFQKKANEREEKKFIAEIYPYKKEIADLIFLCMLPMTKEEPLCDDTFKKLRLASSRHSFLFGKDKEIIKQAVETISKYYIADIAMSGRTFIDPDDGIEKIVTSEANNSDQIKYESLVEFRSLLPELLSLHYRHLDIYDQFDPQCSKEKMDRIHQIKKDFIRKTAKKQTEQK